MADARNVRIALAAGLALLALALGLSLLRSPAIVAATNGIAPKDRIDNTERGADYCQPEEQVPSGTTAIRFSLAAMTGPSMRVLVSSEGRTVSRGERGSGWTTKLVTVPIAPVTHAIPDATVCVSFALRDEKVIVFGEETPAEVAARDGSRTLPGRMLIEYLRPGTRSWASMIPEIATRMGLGRADPGIANVFVALALLLAAIALSALLLVRGLPRAALICALVACLNAACWSIVSPAFEVPDEPDHFAYVKQLAETGRLPSSSSEVPAVEEIAALVDLRYYKVRQQPEYQTIATRGEQGQLEVDLAAYSKIGKPGSPAAGVAASQPPLYYALEAVPYALAWGNVPVLDRLRLMRLLSALMAGLTALFVFLFLREALPGTPWAWTVGALAVALVPLLGFMSGAVSPDSMLFAVSAAVFYALARAFRRGLSARGAVAIGALMAIGFLTKLNFIGMAPGVTIGLLVLTHRAVPAAGRTAYRWLAYALAIAFAPVAVYVVVNLLSNHAPLGLLSAGLGTVHGSLLAELDYIWQLYLPRLPGTTDYFQGLFTTRQLWFDGYVGLYGWLDTTFPGWVYSLALIPAGALAVLCARALFQCRAALRGRAGELAVYALIALGLMVLVGADAYHIFPERNTEYAEFRYMLPLLAPFAAALALAARGAGRRWGPVAGTLIVVLFLAHDIFSQLLVVARFYG